MKQLINHNPQLRSAVPEKIPVYVDCFDNQDLPKFKEDKQLKCSSETTIIKILEYLSSKLQFNKYIMAPDYTDEKVGTYVEMLVENDYLDPQSNQVQPEYISLDHNISLYTISTYINSFYTYKMVKQVVKLKYKLKKADSSNGSTATT